MRLNQMTLPALDVAQSVAFYRKLGFTVIVDAPHYARFQATTGDATFSVEQAEARAWRSQVVVYFECDGLDQQVAALKAKGIAFVQDLARRALAVARGAARRSGGERHLPIPRGREPLASALARQYAVDHGRRDALALA